MMNIELTSIKIPKTPKGIKTFDAILSAASRLICEKGYATITTNHVANLANVNIASLYKYFPNKNAIILTISERRNQIFYNLCLDLGESLALGQPWEKLLEAFFDRYERMLKESHISCAISAAMRADPQLRTVYQDQLNYRLSPLVEALTQRFGLSPDLAFTLAATTIEAGCGLIDIPILNPGLDDGRWLPEAKSLAIRYLSPYFAAES